MDFEVIKVHTFDKGDAEEKVRKVLEEAGELLAEHRKYQFAGDIGTPINEWALMLEIGDVITAVTNYCASLGLSPQDCVDFTEVKNITRGYYDTMDS